MAANDKARCRNIKIKTGVVKSTQGNVPCVDSDVESQESTSTERLAKEELYYGKEAQKEKEKLEKMKEDSTKDEHDIKKQNEIMSESLMMITDCKRKLAAAYEDLSKLVETENDLSESEDYIAAVAMLDQTREQVEVDK